MAQIELQNLVSKGIDDSGIEEMINFNLSGICFDFINSYQLINSSKAVIINYRVIINRGNAMIETGNIIIN